VVAALLAAGAAQLFERYVADLLLTQVTARAVDDVDLGVVPHVLPSDFDPPYTESKLEAIDARLDPLLERARQESSGLLRLNLYARDGTILYSDLASLRGQVVSPLTDALMGAALAGTPGAALVSLDGVTTGDLVARYGSTLEACVPLVLNGHVVGLYELYADPGPLFATRPFTWGLAASLAGLLVLVARGRRRTTPSARPHHGADAELTRRETDVLRLLALGWTYRQIGERLVISQETVRSHVKSILRKLGAPTRAEAVAAARRSGIL
jgi:DNA-binding CsgD family transcriptional regulator